MAWAIFEVYLSNNWDDIQAGKPILCEVQNLNDAAIHVVKAQIAQSAEKLPGGEELMIKTDEGAFKAEKWAIKVLEEFDPDEVELPAPPPIKSGAPIYGSKTTF